MKRTTESPFKKQKTTDFSPRLRRMASGNTVATVTMVFQSVREAQFFLRCGQHHEQTTPCVDKSTLAVNEQGRVKYTLVYEKWQRTNRNIKRNMQWFRCRRRGGFRRIAGVRHVSESGSKRQSRSITEYVGCNCEARYTMFTNPENGQVVLAFKGKHNHDVQRKYASHFLNPILECFAIRDIVDNKLFAGVFNVQHIITAVLNETFKKRKKHTTFEQLRTYHMSVFLQRQQIRNRIMQLGLNPDRLTHKFVFICSKCVLKLHMMNSCA